MSFCSSLMTVPINWILPSRCPVCGQIVSENHQFCLSCWQKLNFISEPWCRLCGVPFSFDRGVDLVCAKCLVSPPEHDGVRAAVVYDDISGRIAMGLKYSAKLGLAVLIAKNLEKYLSDFDLESVLIPVPLHRKRIWSRGFNQSALIADALSKRSNMVHMRDVLVRNKATPPLRSMTAKQRQKLIEPAISLRRNMGDRLVGRTVLLVDDVYTTGATTNACAKLLKTAGASKVIVLCWARVVSDIERI